LLVGIWWFAFSQITFYKLPAGVPLEKKSDSNVIVQGFVELGKVWKQLEHLGVLKIYLISFFFYSMGVQTVMMVATPFGKKVLKLEDTQLIITILVIQLVAIAGAYLMAKLSEKFGNLQVLLFVVFIWVGVCIGAYYTTTATEFYIVAAIVGLVMGGIQSLSRSTYSKLMPPTHDTASFFSFFDVTEKLAIVIGMVTFAYIDERMDMRTGIIALISFFILGAVILFIAIRRSKRAQLQMA
jgi:UMF1 family MFS transporter